MRLGLLTPFDFPSVRGNAITVNRVARHLRQRGVELGVWDCSVIAEAQVEREMEGYRPALIHAFHAFRVGPLALRIARKLGVPLLVTITGTDGNHDLFDPERAQTVRRVLEGAATVTVFHETMLSKISNALPDLAAKIVVIPQSAWLEEGSPYPLAERLELPPGAVIFLFPAGIRMVKKPLFPLASCERLAPRFPHLRLVYAGPILDPEEGERLLRALAGHRWAAYLGTVPYRQMRSLLEASDVVLNCSLSEGGMANSVLEGMACGRAVLASDIEGNRSLVEDGVTGFLFREPGEFEAKAVRLLEDPGLRRWLGLIGQTRVRALYPPEREVQGYLVQYQRLVPAPSAGDVLVREASKWYGPCSNRG
ncbi:MAG: glycosyltransferase family 4 protein [Candidatus Rokubacteria bacterium]|nr:glycosyltransferase family 4 protein [Candidatus Rokubacteria bacterium]